MKKQLHRLFLLSAAVIGLGGAAMAFQNGISPVSIWQSATSALGDNLSEAREELAYAISEAQNFKIDASSAQAVYDNEDSTYDDLTAATQSLWKTINTLNGIYDRLNECKYKASKYDVKSKELEEISLTISSVELWTTENMAEISDALARIEKEIETIIDVRNYLRELINKAIGYGLDTDKYWNVAFSSLSTLDDLEAATEGLQTMIDECVDVKTMTYRAYEHSASYTEPYTQNGITVCFGIGYGSSSPSYQSSENAIYLNQDNELVVSSEKGYITKITIGYPYYDYKFTSDYCWISSGSWQYSDYYSYSDIWTGNTKSVTFRNSYGHKVLPQTITVEAIEYKGAFALKQDMKAAIEQAVNTLNLVCSTEINYNAPLIKSVSQLSANSGTSLGNLIDNNSNTYFNSYGNASTADDYHYIEMDLGKSPQTIGFTYKYPNSYYNPNEIEIQTFDESNDNWEVVVSRSYSTRWSASFDISPLSIGDASKLRFVVKSTYNGYTDNSGYPYFYLDELQAYETYPTIISTMGQDGIDFENAIKTAQAVETATQDDIDALNTAHETFVTKMYTASYPIISHKRDLPYETVTISYRLPDTKVYYTIDGGEAQVYTEPFHVEKTCDIEAWGVHGNQTTKHETMHIDLDYMEINVAKPGEFAQTYLDMNGNDWSKGYYVKVTGTLNEIDLKNIKNLTSLVKLDLSKAVFSTLPNEFMYDKDYLLDVILPESVTTLGSSCFSNCERLRSVTVAGSNNITNIGASAFYYCPALTTFEAPNAETIGNSAFYNCSNLDYKSASKATTIGESAFNSSGITRITPDFFSPALTQIAASLFGGCSKLTEATLPNTIKSIGSSAFYNCTALDSIALSSNITEIGSQAFYNCRFSAISLPDRLTSVGYEAFGNCWNLRMMKCKAVTPPVATSSFMYGVDLTNVDLYVPPFAVDAYRNTAYWEEFYKIRSLIEPIDYIYVERPVEINIDEEDNELVSNKPSIILTNYISNEGKYYSYKDWSVGQLTINGEGTLSASVIDLYPRMNERDYGKVTSMYYETSLRDALPTLVNNADKMRTDSLAVYMTFSYSNHWYFITLPYDVQVKDIVPSPDTYWVIRKYDAAARAEGNTGTTWVDLTEDDVMEAGMGYIVNAYNYNTAPMLTFPSRNTTTKNNIFRSTNVIVPLEEHIAEFAHNRSWNFVGNPYPAYFDTHKIVDNNGETITAPITIWRGSSYQAYSPIDDDLIIRPYESFFIQRPLDQEDITFTTGGRMHFTEAYDISESGNGAYAPQRGNGQASGREVFDFNIAFGELDNRARIVLNDNAKMEYELGRDAIKFFTVADNAPLLYVTDGESYEICERPFADGTAVLGLQTAAEGIYTISLSGRHTDGWRVLLTDNATGVTVNLAEEDYTFNSKQMADANRFSVRFENGEATGILPIESLDQNAMVTVTTIGGVEIFKGRLADLKRPAAGVYLVIINGEATKVSIQ